MTVKGFGLKELLTYLLPTHSSSASSIKNSTFCATLGEFRILMKYLDRTVAYQSGWIGDKSVPITLASAC